jgi:hypothetical protein
MIFKRIDLVPWALALSSGVRFATLASGSRSCAPDLRDPGACATVVKQITADAELIRQVRHRLPGSQQFHGLGFGLGGISFTRFHVRFWKLLVQQCTALQAGKDRSVISRETVHVVWTLDACSHVCSGGGHLDKAGPLRP